MGAGEDVKLEERVEEECNKIFEGAQVEDIRSMCVCECVCVCVDVK